MLEVWSTQEIHGFLVIFHGIEAKPRSRPCAMWSPLPRCCAAKTRRSSCGPRWKNPMDDAETSGKTYGTNMKKPHGQPILVWNCYMWGVHLRFQTKSHFWSLAFHRYKRLHVFLRTHVGDNLEMRWVKQTTLWNGWYVILPQRYNALAIRSWLIS